MRVPVCRALSLGDISQWGKQFLVTLQKESILDVAYEPNVAKYSASLANLAEPQVVFIEALPESRSWILSLRQQGRHVYIVWYGRSFSKDDLYFALEQRVYTVFENQRPEDKKVMEWISRLGENKEGALQFDQLIRSVKAILVQADQENVPKAILSELKTAVTKIERCSLQNEFHNPTANRNVGTETKLPFHRSQDFADALTTVADLERTGVLWVKGSLPNQEGKVDFLQGKIVAVIAGEVHGLKALFRMFLWDEPRFLFTRMEPKEFQYVEHLPLGIKYICEEGMRQRNRYQQIRKEIPPLDLKLALEPSQLHLGTNLPTEDFPALSSIIEFGTVAQVLDYNDLPDVTLLDSMIRLRRSNLLRVVQE